MRSFVVLAMATVMMMPSALLPGGGGSGSRSVTVVSAFVPPHAPHHEHKVTTPKTDEEVEKESKNVVPTTFTKDISTKKTKNIEMKQEKNLKSDNNMYCIPLEKICLNDLPRVGGKTASLGEMIQQLQPLGVDIPGGFAVTSNAYDAVLDRFQLRERLQLLLQDVDGTYFQLRFVMDLFYMRMY